MPWWYDMITRLETATRERNGLFVLPGGAPRQGEKETFARLIDRLADWPPGAALSRKDLAESLPMAAAAVSDRARRRNVDLLAPALAIERSPAMGRYLTLAVKRGPV